MIQWAKERANRVLKEVIARAPATAAVVVASLAAAAIFLSVTSLGHDHLDYGDVPTWLAVVAAAAAGWIALRQLREQKGEIARQAAALERQQADQINIALGVTDNKHPAADRSVRLFYHVTVANNSRRPIRNVTARMAPTPDSRWLESGLLETRSGQGDPPIWSPLPDEDPARARLIRAGKESGFVFLLPWTGGRHNPHYRMQVQFTDDAGLHWQIDQDLHLERLEHRDP